MKESFFPSAAVLAEAEREDEDEVEDVLKIFSTGTTSSSLCNAALRSSDSRDGGAGSVD